MLRFWFVSANSYVAIEENLISMKPWLVALLISGFILLTASAPTDSEQQHRHKRSFKQLPAGLLEPLLPIVKAIVPEPLLGKITMLLPLPAASDSAMQDPH